MRAYNNNNKHMLVEITVQVAALDGILTQLRNLNPKDIIFISGTTADCIVLQTKIDEDDIILLKLKFAHLVNIKDAEHNLKAYKIGRKLNS